jgi:hypothetical protein
VGERSTERGARRGVCEGDGLGATTVWAGQTFSKKGEGGLRQVSSPGSATKAPNAVDGGESSEF